MVDCCKIVEMAVNGEVASTLFPLTGLVNVFRIMTKEIAVEAKYSIFF